MFQLVEDNDTKLRFPHITSLNVFLVKLICCVFAVSLIYLLSHVHSPSVLIVSLVFSLVQFVFTHSVKLFLEKSFSHASDLCLVLSFCLAHPVFVRLVSVNIFLSWRDSKGHREGERHKQTKRELSLSLSPYIPAALAYSLLMSPWQPPVTHQ